MKYKRLTLLRIFSSFFLVLGVGCLFFEEVVFIGYFLLILGSSFGIIGSALSSRYDIYERFHLLASIMGFGIVGVFFVTGLLERVVILALILFVVNFLITIIDLRNGNLMVKELVKKREAKKYDKFNEKEIYNELDNIKDEVGHIQILEEGNIDDEVDLSLKNEAEQIKKEFSQAVVVQDPKEGRYFFKENGKMFHIKGCMALKRMNKKDIKSSNSRTELLARGYKSCKNCNS